MSKNQSLTIKDYPFIDESGIHFASELWSSLPSHREVNDMPSMVENVYNPTIAEILANPSVLVKPRTPNFDEGEDIEYVDEPWNNDLQNLSGFASSADSKSTKEVLQSKSETSDKEPLKQGGQSESASTEEDETSVAK